MKGYTMAQRVETKVTAGSLAAGAAGVIIWALQTWVFKGSTVPDGLVSLVYLAVPAVLAAAAGWLAPHTPRPVAPPPAALPSPPNVVATPAPPVPAEPQPPGATPPPEPLA